MRRAADATLVGEAATVATNRLALITPRSSRREVRALDDLARPGVQLVLAAAEVPAGRYARKALDDAGVLEAVAHNVVSEEEDVKGVVAKVASGEADAGIAYVTDVTASLEGRVRSIPIAGGLVPRYPAAVVSASDQPDQAEAFIRFLVSGDGAEILHDAGFGSP